MMGHNFDVIFSTTDSLVQKKIRSHEEHSIFLEDMLNGFYGICHFRSFLYVMNIDILDLIFVLFNENSKYFAEHE